MIIVVVIPVLAVLLIVLLWCIYLHLQEKLKKHRPEEYELMELS